MNSTGFAESVVEQATLAWMEALGYGIAFGPEIGCGQPGAEREDWSQVVLEGRLQQALQRLNPKIPASAIEEAFRKLTRPSSPSLTGGNHAEVAKWRRAEAERITRARRPDLWARRGE